uniref:Caskin-1 n=1 Tax=Lygus hesperus TaxID=30085 RepID=A0A0A9XKT9_LYGHE
MFEHDWGDRGARQTSDFDHYDTYLDMQNDDDEADFMAYLQQSDVADHFYSRDEIRLRRHDPANRVEIVSTSGELLDGLLDASNALDDKNNDGNDHAHYYSAFGRGEPSKSSNMRNVQGDIYTTTTTTNVDVSSKRSL